MEDTGTISRISDIRVHSGVFPLWGRTPIMETGIHTL